MTRFQLFAQPAIPTHTLPYPDFRRTLSPPASSPGDWFCSRRVYRVTSFPLVSNTNLLRQLFAGNWFLRPFRTLPLTEYFLIYCDFGELPVNDR